MKFNFISSNPDVLGGKPCITGTRISVDMILEWIASGASAKEIVQAYPHISEDAVQEAVRYAAQYLKNDIVLEVKKTS